MSSPAAAEASAVRAGVGWAHRRERAGFVIAGDDRHEYLHRILTAAIRPQPPGSGTRTLLLDNKGRIQADLDLLELPDRLLAVTDAAATELAIETLRRYVLRAAVTLEADRDHRLAIVGPGSVELLGRLELTAPETRPGIAVGDVDGTEVRVLATSALPQGFELAVAPAEVDALVAALGRAGAVAVRPETLEVLRVEAGFPATERELAEAPFPRELGLESAVDFTKGCYLGQETVARIHYRGHVNRLLRGLRLERPPAHTGLEHEGRPAGELTTVVESDRLGTIALGYVRAEHAAAGTTLRVAGGEADPGEVANTVQVVELPFG